MEVETITIPVNLHLSKSFTRQEDFQNLKPLGRIKHNYLRNPSFWIAGSLISIGGYCDMTADILRSDYSGFKKVHPKIHDDFWNPGLSWPNKYKNGNPDDGEKFFLSTSLLSPLTDGLHLVKGIRNVCFASSIVISLHREERKKWYEYSFEFFSACLFYQIGNSMSTFIYKGR